MQLELFEAPQNNPPSQANAAPVPPEAVQAAIGILAKLISQMVRPPTPSAAEGESNDR